MVLILAQTDLSVYMKVIDWYTCVLENLQLQLYLEFNTLDLRYYT